ncbi:carboxypeptidase M32 [Candidatus Thorarchaeota archaeon]|nr:MAG: carboxypeptidase M32 [Candidatus Thorarchaeota archaeon]
MNAYEKLMARMKELVLLGTASGQLGWDLETYMPPKGIQLRSEQISFLSKLHHEMFTSPETGNLITDSEKSNDLDEVQERNLYLTRLQYDRQTKVPSELVGKIAKQRAVSVDTWKKAKAAKDWKRFEPELEKMVSLMRERHEYLLDVKGVSNIYDSMLDDFERGMLQDQIDKVFKELRDGLIPLVKKCADATADFDASFKRRPVLVPTQRKIAEDLVSVIQYDISSEEAGGRIDETEHPFTTGYFDDVRITVNYHEDNVASMIFAILHEGGHALYEQNLNHDWMFQPIGEAASMGIHESMSRFVENLYGRSSQFWDYYYPRFKTLTGDIFADVSKEDWVKAVNLVEPSKIRIEADEVTYSLHVIIRFEIEKALFSDEISISELPQVWNEKYDEYLGVEIEHDAEGVMQDTHWASGYYGYFPSYALGNVYDGMWLEKINRDLPDWRSNIPSGDFSPINKWLVDNVHRHASLYDPADLVKKVTGSSLKAKPFLEYLDTKYSELFGI